MAVPRDLQTRAAVLKRNTGTDVIFTEDMARITDPDVLEGASKRNVTAWRDRSTGAVTVYSRDFSGVTEADLEANVVYALTVSKGPEDVLGEDGLAIMGEAVAEKSGIRIGSMRELRELASGMLRLVGPAGDPVWTEAAAAVCGKYRLTAKLPKIAWVLSEGASRHDRNRTLEAIRGNDYRFLDGELKRAVLSPAPDAKRTVELGMLSDVYASLEYPHVKITARVSDIAGVLPQAEKDPALVESVQKPLALLANPRRGWTLVTGLRTPDGFLSFSIPDPREARALSSGKGYRTLMLPKPFSLPEGNLLGRCSVKTEAGPAVKYARTTGEGGTEFELTGVLTKLAQKAELGRLYRKGEAGALQVISHTDAARLLKSWTNIAQSFRNPMGRKRISEIFEKVTGQKYAGGPAALELYELIDTVTDSKPAPLKKYSELLATRIPASALNDTQREKLSKAGITTAADLIRTGYEGVRKTAGVVGARNAAAFLGELGLDFEVPLMKKPSASVRSLPEEKRRGLVTESIRSSLERIPKVIDRGLYSVPVGPDGAPYRGIEAVELTAKMMTSPRMAGCNVFLSEEQAQGLSLGIRVSGDPCYLSDGTPVYNLAETDIDRGQLRALTDRYHERNGVRVPAYVTAIFPSIRTGSREKDMGAIYDMVAGRYDEAMETPRREPLGWAALELGFSIGSMRERQKTVKVKVPVARTPDELIQKALRSGGLTEAGAWRDGLARVRDSRGKYNFVRKSDGTFLATKGWFDVATEFEGGRATVTRNGESMEINTEGNVARVLSAGKDMDGGPKL